MKIKLSDKRIITPWKTRIITLLQTKYTAGITVDDVIKVYPAGPRAYIEKAIAELEQEGIAEKME